MKKNRILLEQRGVSFEDVVFAIDQGNILRDGSHPLKNKYPNQRLMVVLIKDYVFNVPYVITNEGIFLKTVYPSRKSKKLFFD